MSHWLQQIQQTIEEHHILQHPFFQMLQMGELSWNELRVFAWAYYPHVQSFPLCIQIAAQRSETKFLREIFLDNWMEEQGHGIPQEEHSWLWLLFSRGIGLQEKEVRDAFPIPEVQHASEIFYRLCCNSDVSALSALYCYEYQQPELCELITQALSKSFHITDSLTKKYFTLHAMADIEHRFEMEKGLQFCFQKNKKIPLQSYQQAVQSALDAQWLLMDGVARQAGLHC